MPTYLQNIHQALEALEDQRRHIDADIRDLRAILERHTDDPARPLMIRPSRKAAGKGEAANEILHLMGDGSAWRPRDLAEARGTTSNAASATLRRLLREGRVVEVGIGKYKIAPPKGADAQGSLSDDSEGESPAHPQHAEGVVDEMSRATA